MQIVDQAFKNYEQVYEETFGNTAPEFMDKMNLHDSIVLSCEHSGADLILNIEPDLCDINKIILKNCTILSLDAPLDGAWTLYKELYMNGSLYEMHFLLQKETNDDSADSDLELIDFIITVEDIKLEFSENDLSEIDFERPEN